MFYHGVKASEESTSVSTPNVATCGIPFIVGTAPVHMVEGGKVNVPILANSYEEAVKALGYSEDWEKYTLCEAIKTQFQLYGVAPVVFLNVLDPKSMKKTVEATDVPVITKQVKLPFETIAASVVVKNSEGAQTIKDTDYTLIYKDNSLVIELLPGGSIYNAENINIGYDQVDVTLVTKNTVIGGCDVNTGKLTGLECIDQVLPLYSLVPDLILAPGWSRDSEVAAVMATKAAAVNSLFGCKALVDADTSAENGAPSYTKVSEWKNSKNIVDKNQILCWPLASLGGKKYHMSTHLAGAMATLDTQNGGCPYQSPSNKPLKIDGLLNEAGEDILLDLTAANMLNANGIVTALNMFSGYVSWGNETACYPTSTDVKDYFICVSRTFSWIGATLIRTYWSKVDSAMNTRLIRSIVDSVNIWLNGLAAEGKLLGARVEFSASDNPQTDLMSGIIRFHVYVTPPVPAREIDFLLEYDVNYLNALFVA